MSNKTVYEKMQEEQKQTGRAVEVQTQKATTGGRDCDEMTADICRKISAMTPEELREFADFVKQESPDTWQAIFAGIYPD